jgi:hypothetical protein
MNEKIFFDLNSVDSNLFIDRLKSIDFEVGVTYCVNVFIIDRDYTEEYYLKGNSLEDDEGDFNRVIWIKSVLFSLVKLEDRDERLKKLFSDIYLSVSYTETDEYLDSSGCYYKNAFFICIYKGSLGLIN